MDAGITWIFTYYLNKTLNVINGCYESYAKADDSSVR